MLANQNAVGALCAGGFAISGKNLPKPLILKGSLNETEYSLLKTVVVHKCDCYNPLMNDVFCNRLNQAIDDKGVTQHQLAGVSGVSQAAISQYQTQRRAPTLLKAAALAKALGVSLDWLCGLDERALGPTNSVDTLDVRMRRVATDLDQYVGAARPLDALCHVLLKEFGK